MTKEEARKAAEVMLAYAEGKEKEIEFKCKRAENWQLCGEKGELFFNWQDSEYRIKKESTYRPFKNAKECWEEMLKHQPFGWIRNGVYYQLIRNVNNASIYVDYFVKEFNYEEALGDFIFIDGTPFGIKEE